MDEKRINDRIAQIDSAISDLEAERRALQNLLYNFAASSLLPSNASIRTSRRIYNEQKILMCLENLGAKANVRSIEHSLLRNGVVIKPSTLRSYLTRMKRSGVIDYDFQRSVWKIMNQ